MSTVQYPRSPKEQIDGPCYLGRLIDKVRMRNAGQIQNYNYLSLGFDKYLLDHLNITGEDFEKRVLQGGTDAEIADWIRANGKALTEQETTGWNNMVHTGKPQNELVQQRFDTLLDEVARKRGVSVDQLPTVSAWADLIDLDQDRM